MSYYDDIYERAVDDYYLITTSEAKSIGVPAIELVKLASRGRLERLGQGLYRLARYVPSSFDSYAAAVKRVGRGAYLYGESVIALLDLAPTNPTRITVATTLRVRKSLPSGLRVVKVSEGAAITRYEGIPCQPVAEALRVCKATMIPERISQAMCRACELGYIVDSSAALAD